MIIRRDNYYYWRYNRNCEIFKVLNRMLLLYNKIKMIFIDYLVMVVN